MSTTISQLDVALSYASRGWPVFPCRAADHFDPETGDVLPEKAPLISNGLRGATLNDRVIRELWKRNPEAIVGVPTGERIGAWVLDLDVKAGANGHEWLEAMEAAHGELPASARVHTANGGTHIFFKHVDGVRNRGKLGAGVDVRGEGGFVVAAGSVMGDGRFYEWLDDTGPDDIVDAPQWLLDLVLPPPQAHHVPGDYHYERGSNDHYINRAMESELRNLAGCAPGNRGYQLNASAFALGTLVATGALDRAEAEYGLWDAAVACGVAKKDGERETRAKIRRGLEAGMRQPRQIPERLEDNTRLVDVQRMIANGKAKGAQIKSGDYTQERISAEYTESRIDAAPAGFVATLTDEQAAAALAYDGADTHGAPPEPPAEEPPIHATPFHWIDPATLPRREFAYGTHYIRKYVSVTVSPGGLGKTSNSIAEALAMVSGKALLGIKPPQRMRVWLFNAEDPRDEMERRIMAACIHYKLKPADIEGLYLDTGREQELVVAIDDKRTGVKIQVPVVEAVVAQIERYGIDCMVVDPFVSTHRVNENDNGAIDAVAKLWAQIADCTNCAVDVVHHLRKVADREATVEDARGAVALIGAARSVRVLNRMSEDQATTAGLTGDERYSYFNVHQGKSNLTRMDTSQTWRKLESVALGNGRGLSKPQDHAGVVTEWKWPNSEEVAEGVTQEQRQRIALLLAGQAYKLAKQAKEAWAGNAIVAAMDMDPDDKASATTANSVLKALLKEGFLTIDERRDDRSRTLQRFVVTA
jgi:hypothetical protein